MSAADIVPQPRRRERRFRVYFGWVRWRIPSLTQRTLLSTLKQSPECRRYGCDPDPVSGDRAGQQQDPPPIDPQRDAVGKGGGRMARRVEPGTARRMPWPRASGPSSRITGAEPACTASGCGCVLGPGAPSSPTGAAKAAARYLPERNGRFFGGASRTQPHEAVNGI